jgi:hypothetical protein
MREKESAAKKERKCLRCGACCVLPSGKDCRYLKRLPDKTTLCRIYYRRYNKEIGEGQTCYNREETAQQLGKTYPNCPYNLEQ